MAHTIDDFLNYFPEFSELIDKTIIDRYLLEAELLINLEKCSGIAHLLRYYFTAHMLAKSSNAPEGMDDGVGTLTSKSVDGISESRQVNIGKSKSYADQWYSSTHYGVRFLQLRATCFSGGLVVP